MKKHPEIHPAKSRYVYMKYKLSATRPNNRLRFGCLAAVVLGLGGAALLCGNPTGKEDNHPDIHTKTETKTKDTGHVGKKSAHVTRRNVDTSTPDSDMPEIVEGQRAIDEMVDLVNNSKDDCAFRDHMRNLGPGFEFKRALIGTDGSIYGFIGKHIPAEGVYDIHLNEIGSAAEGELDSKTDTWLSTILINGSPSGLYLEDEDLHQVSHDPHLDFVGAETLIDEQGATIAVADYDFVYFFQNGQLLKLPVDYGQQVDIFLDKFPRCGQPFEYHPEK